MLVATRAQWCSPAASHCQSIHTFCSRCAALVSPHCQGAESKRREATQTRGVRFSSCACNSSACQAPNASKSALTTLSCKSLGLRRFTPFPGPFPFKRLGLGLKRFTFFPFKRLGAHMDEGMLRFTNNLAASLL